MNTFQINRGHKEISIMVNISAKRADEIASIVLASLWLSVRKSADRIPSSANTSMKDIPAQDIYDTIAQNGFDRIDSNNVGEVFYLGIKYMEALSTTSNPLKLAFTMVAITKLVGNDEDTLEVIIGKILTGIETF